MADPEYVLTPLELAMAARMNRKTIYRHIADKKLPARLIGGHWRILASDAEQYLGFRPARPEPRKVAS
jgi:excisionase family DNA binding protein